MRDRLKEMLDKLPKDIDAIDYRFIVINKFEEGPLSNTIKGIYPANVESADEIEEIYQDGEGWEIHLRICDIPTGRPNFEEMKFDLNEKGEVSKMYMQAIPNITHSDKGQLEALKEMLYDISGYYDGEENWQDAHNYESQIKPMIEIVDRLLNRISGTQIETK